MTPSHFTRHVFHAFFFTFISGIWSFPHFSLPKCQVFTFINDCYQARPHRRVLGSPTDAPVVASHFLMTVLCQINPNLPFFTFRYTLNFMQSYKLWLQILRYRLTVEYLRVAGPPELRGTEKWPPSIAELSGPYR